MIASLACMQLVEEGKLHRDNGDELEGLVSNFRELHVLQKDGKLVPNNWRIYTHAAQLHWYVGSTSLSSGLSPIIDSLFGIHHF